MWQTDVERAVVVLSNGLVFLIRLLAALKETLDSFDLTGDPAELLERILEASIAASGATDGSILLYDHQTARLRLHAATGIETELRSKISLAAGEGIAGNSRRRGRGRHRAGR